MSSQLEELAKLTAMRLELQTELLPSLAQFNIALDSIPSPKIVFTFDQVCNTLGQGLIWRVLANNQPVGHILLNYTNYTYQLVLRAIGREAYSKVSIAPEVSMPLYDVVMELITTVFRVSSTQIGFENGLEQ